MRKLGLGVSMMVVLVGCNGRVGGEGDADGSESTGESTGESGDESGDEAGGCEETIVQPVGCEGVEFPGEGEPRTQGVVLGYDHGLFSSGPQALIQFDGESGFACGDTCECEDEDFIVALQNHFEGPGVHELGEGSQVGVYAFTGRTFYEDKGVCGYSYLEADAGTVTILLRTETCVAGVVENLEDLFAPLNGPFMAGTCE